MNDILLKPVDDGLPMRNNQNHSRDKLRVLDGYVHRFITAMHKMPWRAFFYIDLMAGPGKNQFPDGSVMLGSPLIALEAKHPFSHYRFVERDPNNCETLRKRVEASGRKDSVRVLQGDCNDVVYEIVNEIREIDRHPPYSDDCWHSLNLAFLDPEGLELHWNTVKELCLINRMDLIINFSTSSITRNARSLLESGKTDSIDRFFGSEEWQSEYKEASGNSTHVRRALLDLYKKKLGVFRYQVVEPDPSDEMVFKSRRNVQLYTLIGVSKHPRGVQFWQDTISRNTDSGQLSMF